MAQEFTSLHQNSNTLSCRPVFLCRLWQELLASRQWIRWNEVTSRGSSKQPELRVELVHLNTELIYQVVISKVISCHFPFLSHHLSLATSVHWGTYRVTGRRTVSQLRLRDDKHLFSLMQQVINRGKHHSEQKDKKRELGAPEDLLGATCIRNSVILILL